MSRGARWHRRTGVAAGLTAALAGAVSSAAAQELRLDETDEWVEEARLETGTSAAQLATARRALAGGQSQRAEYLATQWIERHPDDPLRPEAYLLRGDAKRARRSYYEALFDYEYVARVFSGSDAFVRALERELEIAELFATGTRRKIWGMRIVDASDEAEELLIRIQERLPGSRLAERAGMALGDFYFSRRKMDLAAEMYRLFIENYPRSLEIRKARKRLIYANLASFKGPEFDASGLYEAKSELELLREVDPVSAQQLGADALLVRIDASEARKMLTTARWYLAVKDPIAAELTLRRLIRDHPRTVAARDAIRLAIDIMPDLPAAVRAQVPDYPALAAEAAAAPEPTAPPDSETPAYDAEIER